MAAAREPRHKPCILHGELCDGVTTLWDQEGEAMERRRGFVEPTPMLTLDSRVMVDWKLLLEEAKVELGMAGEGGEKVD
jgi:hypothetical protein